MKKKIIVFFCLFLVFPTYVLAQDSAVCQKVSSEHASLYTDEVDEKISLYYKKEASLAERHIIEFTSHILNWFNINSLSNLIFGNPYCVWSGGEGTTIHYSLFTEQELNQFLLPTVKIFTGAYVLFVSLSIMLAALKLGWSGISGKGRVSFWDDVKMWIISALLMVLFWPALNILFSINQGIVQSLNQILEHRGVSLNGLSVVAYVSVASVLDILILLAEWLLTAYINLLYVARKVLITLLILIAPVAIISMLYNSTRSFFNTWVRELGGLIFLNAIHALVLFSFLMSLSLSTGRISVVYKLGLLIIFIPISSVFIDWLRLGSSSSNAGKVLGLGGMITAARLLQSSFSQGKRVSTAMRSNTAHISTQGSDKGITSITEAAKGTRSASWNAFKNRASKGGAILGGIAGMPLGGVGAGAFAFIGSILAPALLQAGRNVSTGVAHTWKTVSNVKKEGFSNIWNNLQQRRKFMGNLGESVGCIFGQGKLGRNAFQVASMVSPQRLMNDENGFKGMTLKELAQLEPNAQIQWQQDNQGSAYYMNKGDQWQQISPIGEADPSLKNGEIRRMDYAFNNGSLTLQADGSYRAPQGTTEGMNGNQMIGLSGSTPELMRTSDPYIQGADGTKHLDKRINGSDVNPSSYFMGSIQGTHLPTGGDRMADTLYGWVENRNREKESKGQHIL